MSEPPQEPPQRPDEPRDPHWQPEPEGSQWSQPPAGPGQPGPAQDYPGQQGYPGQGYPGQQGNPGQQWPAQQGYPGAPGASGQPAWGGYPQAPYRPGGSYEEFAHGRPPGPGLAVQLGARLRLRPEPRFSVSLAAVGAALAILGGLIWTIGYYAEGLHVHFTESGLSADGESRRFLGFALGLVLAAVGYLLLIRRRRGPLATAGAVLAAIGVPVALGFVTLDIGGVTTGSFPLNLDVVYLVSILIWIVTYFLVPGGRGRAFFLGLALLELPSYIEYKSAAGSLVRSAEVTTIGGGGFNTSDLSTGGLTAIGLIFGLVYYAAAFALDRRGMRGAAVAFVVAGFFTTASGVFASVGSFKQAGTGIELLILGAALSWYGSRFGRRFTTWFWAAMIPVGVVVLVVDVSPDNTTGAGISILVIGLIIVALAVFVSTATNEPADVDEPTTPPATGVWPGQQGRPGGPGGFGGFGQPGAHV